MKLREIITTWSNTGYPDSYRHHFKNTTRVAAFDNLQFTEKLDGDTHFLGLFFGDKLVSYLNLEVRDTPYYQVVYSATDAEFYRKGCFRFLINSAVASHGTILSDFTHTPEAKIAWQSLIKNTGGTMDIFVYNTHDNTTKPTKNVPIDDIWNDRTEPVLMATNVNHTMEELNRIKKVTSNLLEHGRDYNSMWYGKNNKDDI